MKGPHYYPKKEKAVCHSKLEKTRKKEKQDKADHQLTTATKSTQIMEKGYNKKQQNNDNSKARQFI